MGLTLQISKSTLRLSGLWVSCLVAQLCPALCNPRDCSLPGSSVHGILQARILEWPCPPPGDLPKPDLKPRSPTLQEDSLLSEPPGKTHYSLVSEFFHHLKGNPHLSSSLHFLFLPAPSNPRSVLLCVGVGWGGMPHNLQDLSSSTRD